jgi:hypothetical protein
MTHQFLGKFKNRRICKRIVETLQICCQTWNANKNQI